MIIRVKDIKIKNISTAKSEVITIKSPSQFDMFYINYSDDELSIYDVKKSAVFTNEIPAPDDLYIRVIVTPRPTSKSRSFSINLTNSKSNKTITISGRIIIDGLNRISPVTATGTSCSPVFEKGKVKLLLDQNKYSSCSFTLSGDGLSIPDGAITNYTVKSKNGLTGLGSDLYLVNTSISSISFASNVCTIQLTNPNAIGHALDAYGFSKETEYVISFTQASTLYDSSFNLNVIINLKYKSTNITFATIRTQEAVFDIYHRATLINHDFALSTDVDGKQFSFGLKPDKQYSVPVKLNTIIPNALTFLFDPGLKPLEIAIFVQSISKVNNYYSSKLILEIKPPPNKSLFAGKYEIPAYIKLRDFKHKFNIPIKLNG